MFIVVEQWIWCFIAIQRIIHNLAINFSYIKFLKCQRVQFCIACLNRIYIGITNICRLSNSSTLNNDFGRTGNQIFTNTCNCFAICSISNILCVINSNINNSVALLFEVFCLGFVIKTFVIIGIWCHCLPATLGIVRVSNVYISTKSNQWYARLLVFSPIY